MTDEAQVQKVKAVLEELKAIGVEVTPQGTNLVIRPASKVPAELKERLKAHKAEVLAVLKAQGVSTEARPATCAASCYEVEPGLWIHRPWDGCNTEPRPQPLKSVPQVECRHCDGAGECCCPACTLRRTEKPVAMPYVPDGKTTGMARRNPARSQRGGRRVGMSAKDDSP